MFTLFYPGNEALITTTLFFASSIELKYQIFQLVLMLYILYIGIYMNIYDQHSNVTKFSFYLNDTCLVVSIQAAGHVVAQSHAFPLLNERNDHCAAVRPIFSISTSESILYYNIKGAAFHV